MSHNQTESKPPSVEEPRDEGLDETTCCASLVWEKTKDDPEIHTAEVSPSYRYFLLGACGKYIACYSSGTAHKVVGYIHTAGTKMETMEEAKARCEIHRHNVVLSGGDRERQPDTK